MFAHALACLVQWRALVQLNHQRSAPKLADDACQHARRCTAIGPYDYRSDRRRGCVCMRALVVLQVRVALTTTTTRGYRVRPNVGDEVLYRTMDVMVESVSLYAGHLDSNESVRAAPSATVVPQPSHSSRAALRSHAAGFLGERAHAVQHERDTRQQPGWHDCWVRVRQPCGACVSISLLRCALILQGAVGLGHTVRCVCICVCSCVFVCCSHGACTTACWRR